MTLVLGITLSCAVQAQMPRDNAAWRARCSLLTTNSVAIQTGTIPSPLAGSTHGIPALQFMTFGFERRKGGEHNVACTLFYMAVLAERTSSEGKADPKVVQSYADAALAEFQQAHGLKVPMAEKMKRFDAEMAQMKAPSLTANQLQAILDAASVMPVTLNAPARLP